MLIWTTRFSKKKAVLAVLILGLVVTLCILLSGTQDQMEPAASQLTTNEDRIAYLKSMGWDVASEPLETLQFLLPDPLTESYLSYNELQQAQGFDLSAYCGKQIARYTYAVSNYPGYDNVQLNLYLCEGTPVAGDVLCPGADGFQETLVYPGESSPEL